MKSKGFRQQSAEEVRAKQLAKLKIYQSKTIQNKKIGKVSSLPKKKLKKAKLKTISQLKKILWKLVSDHVKKRDKKICFTSGKEVEGSNCHCGHGIPSAVGGALTRYHPFNLHVQSYHENINLGGNGGEYYRRQVIKYGQEEINKLYELKNHSIQADRYFYMSMIDLYKVGDETEIIKFINSYL